MTLPCLGQEAIGAQQSQPRNALLCVATNNPTRDRPDLRPKTGQTMSSATATRNISLDAALREAEERFTAENPASRKRHDEARASMPGGNTRTVLYYSPFPLTMVKGEGARLWDMDGHGYIDFLGEYTAGL